MIKINLNYFVVSKRWDNFKYFLARGHFFRLVWDRFKWYWFPRLNIVPRFPQTVDIETSLSCNLQCPMCTRAAMDPANLGGIMDFDLFKKIVDECAARRVFSIKLSWRGEPTMNPRLLDMVRYAKAQGIPDVAFLTNGGLLSREDIDELIAAGLDWISFSIDGLHEDYERIRYPITFEHIVGTVTYLKQAKARLGVKKPLVRVQTISGVVHRSNYFEFWEPLVDRIAVIAEQHREDASLIRHDPDYVCQSPFQRVFITHDGTVVPCHGDYFLHHNMGNARQSSIAEVWNSEGFAAFRRDMRRKKRLEYEGCRLCPDGGEYIGEEIEVGGRRIKAIRYLGNDEPPRAAAGGA